MSLYCKPNCKTEIYSNNISFAPTENFWTFKIYEFTFTIPLHTLWTCQWGWLEAPRAWTKFTWREIYPTSTWNQLGNTLQSDPKFLLFPNLTHTPLPIAAERPEHSLQDAWWPAHPHKRIDSVTCQNTWLIRWHRWKASEVSNQNKHWIEIDILSCDCEG